MQRIEADQIAVERQSVLFDVLTSVTNDWHTFDDHEKRAHLTSAIEICRRDFDQAEDEDLESAIQWEIDELTKALTFFQIASGQAPCQNQINFLA
jgi:hypothetical protein